MRVDIPGNMNYCRRDIVFSCGRLITVASPHFHGCADRRVRHGRPPRDARAVRWVADGRVGVARGDCRQSGADWQGARWRLMKRRRRCDRTRAVWKPGQPRGTGQIRSRLSQLDWYICLARPECRPLLRLLLVPPPVPLLRLLLGSPFLLLFSLFSYHRPPRPSCTLPCDIHLHLIPLPHTPACRTNSKAWILPHPVHHHLFGPSHPLPCAKEALSLLSVSTPQHSTLKLRSSRATVQPGYHLRLLTLTRLFSPPPASHEPPGT